MHAGLNKAAAYLAAAVLAPRVAHAEGIVEKDYIVTFKKDGVSTSSSKCNEASVSAKGMQGGGRIKLKFKRLLEGCVMSLTEGAAEATQQRADVELVEEDGEVHAQAVPSWGLDRINQAELPLDDFAEKVDADGVKIFIVDTGIKKTHMDFSGMINDPSTCHWYDSSLTFANPGPLADGNGHGTHIASTACGNTYGVAENCELCSIRILGDNGSGSFSGVISGLEHAVTDCENNPPAKGCVTNMSLVGGFNQGMNDAVKAAVDAGMVVVVAAGNSQRDACSYSPASEPSAITMGATTSADQSYSLSNYGTCVDFYAPGSGITAAGISSDTASAVMTGTSMATAHVAGIAAGIVAGSSYLPAQVKARIEQYATANCDGCDPNLIANTLGVVSTPSPTPWESCHERDWFYDTYLMCCSNHPRGPPKSGNTDLMLRRYDSLKKCCMKAMHSWGETCDHIDYCKKGKNKGAEHSGGNGDGSVNVGTNSGTIMVQNTGHGDQTINYNSPVASPKSMWSGDGHSGWNKRRHQV